MFVFLCWGLAISSGESCQLESNNNATELSFLLGLHRIPIQTSYGRRPVLIFSTLICLVSNIWRAEAQSYGSYMGACVLNGFGAGPAEVFASDYPGGVLPLTTL